MGQPAARMNDMHTCPMVESSGTPHVGGPILPGGNSTVLIENMPAAVVGDNCVCTGPPDSIVSGSGTVFVNGLPAARVGDSTAHGGAIVAGSGTVLIG